MGVDALVYGRGVAREAVGALVQLVSAMRAHGWTLLVYRELYDALRSASPRVAEGLRAFESGADLQGPYAFMVSVGGDGTFLDSAQYVMGTTTPIIGVNFGHLGFLTSGAQSECQEIVRALEEGRYSVEPRTLLRVNVYTEGSVCQRYQALNDVTVQKSEKSMLRIDVDVDGTFLCSYWCDGLIVSTPTGSTAYSLSVGGPIIVPGTEAMLLCPIAPHNLSMRPLVLPDRSTLRLRAVGRDPNVVVGVDAHRAVISGPVMVDACRSEHSVHVVRLAGESFFTSIRNKLHWGVDARN